MKKGLIWTIIYGICLASFTVYITLDTFVLSSAYKTNTTEMNTSMFENVTSDNSGDETETESESDTESADTTDSDDSDDNYNNNSGHHGGHHHRDSSDDDDDNDDNDSDDNEEETSSSTSSASSSSTSDGTVSDSYQDDNISITLTEYYENSTKIYVADIQVSSAEYLKTAFANDTYGKNVTQVTSKIASNHSAILAINGDYYGAQESGYVIRNGIVYRDTASSEDVLCIYADGTMKAVDPSEKTAQELVDEGVWQAFSFGPTLIENGSVSVSENDEVGKAKASNPRTAIGIIDSCHYVFVVSDGRTSESKGLSLYQLATFMQGLGVTTAYNLDGGGSSTMYFNGEVVNNPTSSGRTIEEREVSDIVYIG